MKYPLKNLLFSSWFLYFIVFVVFFNLIGHALNNNFMVILLFILVSFITSFFSKNMIVILVIGIAVSNIIVLQRTGYREGMSTDRELVVDDVPEDADDDDSKLSMKDFTLKSSSSGSGSMDQAVAKKSDFIKQKIEDIKKAKKTMEQIKTKMPDDPNKLKMTKEEDEFVRGNLSNLLDIQNDILTNMDSLEKSVLKVDHLVDDVKSKIDFVRKSMPNPAA